MPTVLLINPNTSAAVTERMAAEMRAVLGPAHTLRPVTARFGASYIASEVSYAVAAHAALDAWASQIAEGHRFDAICVGCFGDPGVTALRECAGVPVVGLAEAALREAALHGDHVVVTGGAAWRPMLERFVAAQGLAEGLEAIHLIEKSGAALMAQPDGGATEVRAALLAALSPRTRALVIGGAALGGLARQVADAVPVPVIDSVQAGARWLVQVLSQSRAASAPTREAEIRWSGLSEALMQALTAAPGAARSG